MSFFAIRNRASILKVWETSAWRFQATKTILDSQQLFDFLFFSDCCCDVVACVFFFGGVIFSSQHFFHQKSGVVFPKIWVKPRDPWILRCGLQVKPESESPKKKQKTEAEASLKKGAFWTFLFGSFIWKSSSRCIYIYSIYIYVYVYVYDRYDRYRLKIVIYISILDVQLPLPFDKKMPRPPRSRKNLSCLNPISRRRQLKQRASSLYTCISIC